MDVKAALTGNNRKLILESCEYGEDAALETYDNVLAQNINENEKNMIKRHFALLKADHDKIKALRDLMASEEVL